jgi:adenylylsulfate kinase
MGSTYERSFLKGFIWEIVSFVITFIAVYIVFGDFKTSLGFSLVLSLIKVSIFFIHERIWKSIRWGKIKDKK